MKWSDLSFKEKKQIYDSIKAQNPDTTYLDIKSQFDSIPAYEDGGKKIMPPKELGLTPGTPSNVDDYSIVLDPSTYFRSGRANGAVRNQYDLYIDKQRYIDRLNRLVPMEWLLPTIGLGGAEFLRENKIINLINNNYG